jgi:phenylalanyl-tRNA synthetase beta chain
VGQNSISLLVDLSNYFMLEFNRPCHFFDASAIQGNLVVKNAQQGEVFTALKEVEYRLPEGAVVIEDDQGLISLAGIKGGHRGSVNLETTDILIEIAHFHPDAIARAGRALGLHSDARYRFERHVDPFVMEDLMERLTAFVLLHAGTEVGTKAGTVNVTGALPEASGKIDFDPALIQKLTGVDVKDPWSILEKLGCSVEKTFVTPPSWRSDITLPQDLVEEVLRIVGYSSLETLSLPATTQNTKGLEKMKFDLTTRVRKGLASKGYHEVVTFSFMHSQKAAHFGKNDLIIKNPISSELDMMRPSIVGNLLEAVAKNQARSLMRGAFFEIGPQYDDQGQQAMITGLKFGLEEEKEWFGSSRTVDIYDIRADIDFIAKDTPFTLKAGAPAWYHPGRSGTLMIKDKILGYFGQIHPKILKDFDVKGTVVAFEIFQGNLKLSKPKESFEKSSYQCAERDFAFTVTKETSAGDVVVAIETLNIKSAKIFDVFEKDGEKSIAVRVTLDPKDHTFTNEELEMLSKNIVTTVEKQTGGTLRR